MRTGTLFGAFGIDPETGRQMAHRMLTVQWHKGRKVTIEPDPLSERSHLDFPTGSRLIAAGADLLGFSRRSKRNDDGYQFNRN